MYLETRVNDFLKRHNHPESGEVTVRVVHVSDKVVEVKPGMKSRSDRMIKNRHWFNTKRLCCKCNIIHVDISRIVT